MASVRVWGVIAAASALVGCGDLVLPDGPDAGSELATDDLDGGADADADGPSRADSGTIMVSSLTASTWQLRPGQSIQFVATFSDSLGVSNVLSGELLDEQGIRYAVFPPTGTFTTSVTLNWTLIDSVRPIEFTPPGGRRTFVARFRNRLGHSASADVDVHFLCDPPDRMGACSGVCTDMWSNANCGQCGLRCDRTCVNGACP